MKTDKQVLSAVFLTVFLDLLGFAMIFPLLPFYAESHGADPMVIGLLIASYSAAQLLSAPVLGRLSDSWGRGPVVAATAFGAACGYGLFVVADGLVLIFVARIITGLCAGNIAAAQATVADVMAPADRVRGMAVIGAAIGLGVVFGPGLTALSVPIAGETAPFALAGIFALVNSVWAWRVLPRTRGRSPRLVATLARALRDPRLTLLLATNLLVMVAFSQIESQFPLVTDALLGFGPVANGYLFMYIGLMIVVFQLTGTRWLSTRIGEDHLILLGLGCFAAGSLLVPFVTQWWHVLVPGALIAIGNATQAPALMAAVSRQAEPDSQGAVLGASQSAGAAGRIVGPIVGGFLFAHVGPTSPYVVGGLVFVGIATMFASGRRVLERTAV